MPVCADRAPTSAIAAARPNTGRLPLLDSARTIAAIGVIAAHVLDELFPDSRFKLAGTYAVPFYLFVAIYFTVRGLALNPTRTLPTYLAGRVVKLYVPFLVWNLAYDVLHMAMHGAAAGTSLTLLPWAAFYTHLYFLPFLLLATFVVAPLVRPLMTRPTLRAIVTIVFVAAGCAVGFGPLPHWLDQPKQIGPETLWNCYRAIPATCFAAAFALNVGLRRERLRTTHLTAIAGVALCLACVALQCRYGPHPILRSASGFGLLLVAFSTFDARWLQPLAWAGRLSFGIYLSHVVFIRLAMALVGARAMQQPGVYSAAIITFAYVGGLIFSAIVASSPYTRWIIGCETDTMRAKQRQDAGTSSAGPVVAQTLMLDPTAQRSA